MFGQPKDTQYAPTVKDLQWQDDAACNRADLYETAEFTSPANGPHQLSTRARDLAAKYCNHCPVIAQCAKWAEEDVEFRGVAAGRAYGEQYRTAQRQATVAKKVNRG